jgi:hypothetical protein
VLMFFSSMNSARELELGSNINSVTRRLSITSWNASALRHCIGNVAIACVGSLKNARVALPSGTAALGLVFRSARPPELHPATSPAASVSRQRLVNAGDREARCCAPAVGLDRPR